MKQLAVVLAFAALTAAASVAFGGQLPATGVNGSMHDMNMISGAQQDTLQRVCVFCHTPHNATKDDQANGDNYPLWNHTLVDTTGWQSYQWATPANNALTIYDPLQGPSRLCMSCHDGVTAIDEHGPALAQAGGRALSGDRAVGRNKDLTDDHPIGFSYVDAVNARNTNSQELALTTDRFATNVTLSPTAGTYNTVDRTSGKRAIGDVLYGGSIMTCASCHDVHNKDNAVDAVASNGIQYNYFLWAKEKDSLICLSCHIK
ncbi:cytochrome C [Geobacter sp. AOG2]|uniref:cytochrome C n=1 Tax=Geobacter sp. AOG2 TaxID=1566347 RepID=UPI001CC42D64|nr:cytochrome C [Geobacter sp. AOG2]GFE62111.1 cytochrome c [Geobacter sp. AOG2]